METTSSAPAWIVASFNDEAATTPQAWWHNRAGNWTQERDLASRMTQAEAETMADDWNSRSQTRGFDARYRAEPAPEHDDAEAHALKAAGFYDGPWNEQKPAPEIRYIDMTPTWREAAQIIALALENGTDKGRDAARAELFRMADILDALRAEQKETGQ